MTTYPFAGIRAPNLPVKPRSSGLTAVLDKGLGPLEVTDLLSVAGDWIDVVKFGWGTARLQPEAVLRTKLASYAAAGVRTCTGGTFMEVALSQGKVPAFLDEARKLGFQMVEVSNGVHPMDQQDKLDLIRRARDTGLMVWSEVGRKDPEEDARIPLEHRLSLVAAELEAGSERVILEGRESGTVGIYDRQGRPAEEMLDRIVGSFDLDCLVFEAPKKSQQVYLIRRFGSGVTFGNVQPNDALPLATLRAGLRGDTFAAVHMPGVEVFLELGPGGALAARERGGVVVLIDALRASATIVTALAEGMNSVRPVATPGECVGDVTAGERGGRKLPNADHGNSPLELIGRGYSGRYLTLTTTNGTECLLTASGPATVVLVGTTLNSSAVAQAALDEAGRLGGPISLLMAGRNNEETREDSIAAGAILGALGGRAHLRGTPPHTSASIEADFFASASGQNLTRLGYAEDVKFCAQVDRFQVVPVYRDGLLIPVEAGEAPVE